MHIYIKKGLLKENLNQYKVIYSIPFILNQLKTHVETHLLYP